MNDSFDSARFVRNVGDSLVAAFDNARTATTPELVASAMETAARMQLEQILPSGVGVGTGCVIDTYGSTSRQMDVILFERDLCPVFRINDNDPKAAYYPCEGVIAVGEIKSVIGKKELEDSFAKMSSVKALRRNYEHPKYPDHNGRKLFGYRKYGERTSALRNDIMSAVNYGPDNSEASKIYGFILGGKRAVSEETLKGHYSRLVIEYEDTLCPNNTTLLDGTVFDPARPTDGRFATSLSAESGRCILVRRVSSPFSVLISRLHSAYSLGGTAETEVFGEYYLKPQDEDVVLLGLFPIRGKYILMEDLYGAEAFPDSSCTSCGHNIRHGDGGRQLDEKRVICATCAAGR